MKYIMFELPMGDNLVKKVPIIFPDILVHKDVAESIQKLEGMEKATVVSAGTYSSLGGTTSDKSSTLGISSREEDENTIRMYDYVHGIEDRD